MFKIEILVISHKKKIKEIKLIQLQIAKSEDQAKNIFREKVKAYRGRWI